MAFKNRAKTAELESGRLAAARTGFGWDSYAAHLGVGGLGLVLWVRQSEIRQKPAV